MTSNSVDEIIAAIKKAQNDPVLPKLMRRIGGGEWRSWIPLSGVNASVISLIEKLEIRHPKLSDALFRVRWSGEKITPVDLAQWLVKRTVQVGAESAYASVLNLEDNSKVTAYNVTLIRGLHFSKSIDFQNGIQLVGCEYVPNNIRVNISEKINQSLPNIHPPYTFLVQPISIDLLTADTDDSVRLEVKSYVDYEYAITNFLSLFSRKQVPVIDRIWCLLSDDTPMAGFVDCSSQSYLEIRPPKFHEDLNPVVTDEIQSLYLEYQAIPKNLRLPIDVSMWRRGQAMNSWDSVNKAIDLGVAMEAVLTVPKTREQLSLQVRILGAKLAFPAGEQRTRAYAVLKCAYEIRSDAVHNGFVKKSYKIKGESEKPVNDILYEATEILRRCLKEIIKRKGLSREQAEQLFLDA